MAPHHDELEHDMNAETRQRIERAIAKAAVEGLLAAGFQLSVFAGETTALRRCGDGKTVLDAMFSTDEDTLFVWARPTVADAPMERIGWVQLIYGNNGWDVVSDYTVNLEDALKGAKAKADELEREYN